MSNKAVISLTTGLEDSEKVTVAFLVAVGAAESGRSHLDVPHKAGGPARSPWFRSGPCVRWLPDASRIHGPVWTGWRPLPGMPDLLRRTQDRQGNLMSNAELGGTFPIWGWWCRRRDHLQLLTPYILRPHRGNP